MGKLTWWGRTPRGRCCGRRCATCRSCRRSDRRRRSVSAFEPWPGPGRRSTGDWNWFLFFLLIEKNTQAQTSARFIAGVWCQCEPVGGPTSGDALSTRWPFSISFFFVVVVAVVVAVERSCFVFKLAPILELTTIRNPPRVQPMEPDRRLFNQTWVSWFELIVVYSKQMTCDRYATEPDDNLLTGWFEQVFFEKKDESVGWKRSDPPITEFYRVLLGFTEFY